MRQRQAWELGPGDRCAMPARVVLVVGSTRHVDDGTVFVHGELDDGRSYSRQVAGTAPFRVLEGGEAWTITPGVPVDA